MVKDNRKRTLIHTLTARTATHTHASPQKALAHSGRRKHPFNDPYRVQPLCVMLFTYAPNPTNNADMFLEQDVVPFGPEGGHGGRCPPDVLDNDKASTGYRGRHGPGLAQCF